MDSCTTAPCWHSVLVGFTKGTGFSGGYTSKKMRAMFHYHSDRRPAAGASLSVQATSAPAPCMCMVQHHSAGLQFQQERLWLPYHACVGRTAGREEADEVGLHCLFPRPSCPLMAMPIAREHSPEPGQQPDPFSTRPTKHTTRPGRDMSRAE